MCVCGRQATERDVRGREEAEWEEGKEGKQGHRGGLIAEEG